ncbi:MULTISPECIES: agmatine/peptidylarginine deiminase [Bacillus cereus group]|uniref:Agmatine deiminase n=1 Tax=Bacillus paramycoides TaxID=2026194 RepID=A0A1J9VYT3_9BACI|nr:MULTISPECIES: agmatine deiminase family protein [Bacillus cereus group]MED0963104.1 agmatine deiminase family protein [Bacillus paramycoides]MED0978467.1 agmatine deiminase family protein [Bacillus paramycoides]MED1093066.1 agmatine deiminase family protein [Bacillus paramycoides]MED1105089.1 agmatine deiminase family protein [Bacillus paramycoides]MED1557266.1 agmatine deiminase family protein [Bacillus paramycoides]
MKKIVTLCLVAALSASIIGGCAQEKDNENTEKVEAQEKVGKYTMPDEKSKHEGTWLQWPHDYTYGQEYKKEVEPIWIEMVSALTEGEKVHIVAYDQEEKERINQLLTDEGLNMEKIDFFIAPTDDVWARDSGPMFVYDNNKNLKILDPGFNGWGKKTPYKNDARIRENLSKQLGVERIDWHKFVLEGGAIELDGNGTALLTRSAVTNKNRNSKLSEAEIEKYISELGVTNFIWLDGVPNIDITDFHIDGFAKFHDKSTIITLAEDDLVEWGLSNKDIDTLMRAKNAAGGKYKYVYLPLSKNKVTLESGKTLDYKGSYVNYYIGNKVVLVPNYNDPNDKIANETIQKLYPDRKVVGIDVRELYKNGGMIHCITQQQPVSLK